MAGGGIIPGTAGTTVDPDVVPLLGRVEINGGFNLTSPDVAWLFPSSIVVFGNTGPLPGGGGIIVGAAFLARPAFPRRVPRSLRIFEDNEPFAGGGTILEVGVLANPALLSVVPKDPKFEMEGVVDETMGTFKFEVGKVLMDINDGILVAPEVTAVLICDCCGGGGGGGGGGTAGCKFSPAWSEINTSYLLKLSGSKLRI